MRKAAFSSAIIFLSGAALAALAAAAQTNTPAPPPSSPHWYQTVANGVTLHHTTPVAYFRALLGMTPAEREQLLANKPARERDQVLAKVREYEALPPEVREKRLFQTELRWHLLALMRLDPARRKARLNEISPVYQPMVLSRLDQWDQLPAELRKTLLEKQEFLRAYIQCQETRDNVPDNLPAGQRAHWKEELSRWQALPEGRREALCAAFRQFFYSTEDQRRETAGALSAAEREQMEQALQSYAELPAARRRECVESFSKFATMSQEERSQFLQNAAKWEAMTAHERQLWRTLVDKLPPMPPMPPGFDWSNMLPPMPPGWCPPPTPPVASNPAMTNLAKFAK